MSDPLARLAGLGGARVGGSFAAAAGASFATAGADGGGGDGGGGDGGGSYPSPDCRSPMVLIDNAGQYSCPAVFLTWVTSEMMLANAFGIDMGTRGRYAT